MKNKKDLRVEIVKSLEDDKEFNLYWNEEVTLKCCIKAKSEEDARAKFRDGEIDWNENDAEELDRNFVELSLDVWRKENNEK